MTPERRRQLELEIEQMRENAEYERELRAAQADLNRDEHVITGPQLDLVSPVAEQPRAVLDGPHPGRMLSLKEIGDAYRSLRDADPPEKATKVTTADQLRVHTDTIDRTLRDYKTTWRDFKRTA